MIATAVRTDTHATSFLSECAGDVARHRAQLPGPRTPAVVATDRDAEVPVAPADGAVLLVEIVCAAVGLIGVADHRRGIAGAAGGAEYPDSRVVLRQQCGVHVGVVPLPPTQLRGAPHPVAVDAAKLPHAGQERAVVVGSRGGQET